MRSTRNVSGLRQAALALAAVLLLTTGGLAQEQAPVENPAVTEAPAAEAPAAEVPAVPAAEAAAAQNDPAAPAAAGDPAAAPAEAEKVPPMACTVKAVKGTVEWRPNEKAAWQPAAEDIALVTGSDIRTGFRASCSLIFKEASSAVQLEPLTIIRIGEFEMQADGKVRTRLYLKRGATKSIVEKTRMESDFAIVTPEATLAVRGTRVIRCTHQADFGTRISLSNSGLIHVRNNLTGRDRQLQPGDQVTGQMLLAIENAQFNRAVPIFDQFGGVTQNEAYSILRGPQTFAGVGTQSGTGSDNLVEGGDGAFNQDEFLRQYNEFLSQYGAWLAWLEEYYPDIYDEYFSEFEIPGGMETGGDGIARP